MSANYKQLKRYQKLVNQIAFGLQFLVEAEELNDDIRTASGQYRQYLVDKQSKKEASGIKEVSDAHDLFIETTNETPKLEDIYSLVNKIICEGTNDQPK